MNSPHPAWALAHKQKGTELKRINGRYYLYKVSSKWNPQKKSSVKITGPILGSITQEKGFVESDKARLRRQNDFAGRIQVKEYGITAAVETLFADAITPLKKLFPQTWPTLIDYAKARCGDKRHFDGPFKHENRFIWHYSVPVDEGKTLTVFLDEELRCREQKD